MNIAGHELHRYRLPYRRPVEWYNSQETGGAFVALRLFGDNGARGVAEAPVKATWCGLTPGSLITLVEELYLPALSGVDIIDLAAVRKKLGIFPGNQIAKMLVVNACASLAAADEGTPLHKMRGGTRSVEVSWCVTRQPPDVMAAEATAMVLSHGFNSLKLKGGQGFDCDRQVLREVRRAVGDKVSLTVDANGAYRFDEAGDYLRLLADEGVILAEDPVQFSPDPAFTALVERSPLPLLVDSPCITAKDATAFLEAGAQAISIKPGRIGYAEADAIHDLALHYGAGVCAGMYAESALGSLLSLSFASTLGKPVAPAEQSFYLLMSEQVLGIPLAIENGRVLLPENADIDALVDWERLGRLGGI